MKLIKNLIFLFILFSFFACDTSEDYFFELDECKNITIKPALSDSFNIVVSDSNKINRLFIVDFLTDSCNSIVVNQTAGKDSILVNSNQIQIFSLSNGLSKFDIFSIDKFGKSKVAHLNLLNFSNLLPIASFEITQPNIVDDLEICISAKNSYDRDTHFGGKIINYKYIINNDYEVITPISEINYIFSLSGMKKISVAVQDNDSAWSETITKTLFIN